VLVVTLEPVESPRAAGAPMLVALARCLRIACYEYGGWRNVDGNGCSESIALPRQILPSIRRTIMWSGWGFPCTSCSMLWSDAFWIKPTYWVSCWA